MGAKERIDSDGKKKILALDGGGIRGMITVEILGAIEEMLAEEQEEDDFVLSDYFDFICGTSTGAIIAACLSMGMSVAKLRQFYIDSGAEMFDKASLLKRYHKYMYEDEALAELLKKELGGVQKQSATGSCSISSGGTWTPLILVDNSLTVDHNIEQSSSTTMTNKND